MIRDLYSNLGESTPIALVTHTADADGTGIDMQGFSSLMLVAVVGVSGDTLSGSVYIELEVEESDDDSTYTDVANADLQNTVTGTNVGTFALIDDPAEDALTYKTGYLGNKRYIRPVVNVTGTHTNGTPITVIAIRGHAENKPVNA